MAEFLSTLTGVQHANPDGTDRQTLIARCQLGERLALVLDTDDPRGGEHAVAVCRAGGGRLGHLPDADAQRAAAHMRSGRSAWAEVKKLTGGTREWPRRGINVVVHLDEGRSVGSPAPARRGCLSAVFLAALIAGVTAAVTAATLAALT